MDDRALTQGFGAFDFRELYIAADRVQLLLLAASQWLREHVGQAVAEGDVNLRERLDAFRKLSACRKDLSQRNANPQMIAERAFVALRLAVTR